MKLKEMQEAKENGTLVAVGKYAPKPAMILALRQRREIGRASCRERV